MFIFFFYSTNISFIRFKDIKDIMFKYFVFIFLNILVDGCILLVFQSLSDHSFSFTAWTFTFFFDFVSFFFFY